MLKHQILNCLILNNINDMRYIDEIKFFIDGKWTLGNFPVNDYQDFFNPSTGKKLGRIPVANSSIIHESIESAKKGFDVWRNTSPNKRCEIILKACSIIRERLDYIANLSTLELGTPLRDSKSYVLRAVEILEWDANEGKRLYGRIIPSENNIQQFVVHEPVGIVAAFSPWNAPFLTPCRKIGSALAAGCSIIIKAAEETPASAVALFQCFDDAGTPPGVINLIFGNPDLVSDELINHDDIRMITFTGSVPIGKKLAEKASSRMKPILMELGGHASVIVCEDADIEDAAKKCAISKFRNSGQACIAPTRFYIHDKVYKKFIDFFIDNVALLKVGDPLDEATSVGPLANQRRLELIDSLVIDALKKGAKVLHGGVRLGRDGFFYQPTILGEIPESADVLRNEPFGPIACMIKFDNLEKAITKANELPYGLASYAFTKDASKANYISRKLDCGAVAINHLTVSTVGIPFGGVKDSGIGREGGTEGVASYTVKKTITQMFI